MGEEKPWGSALVALLSDDPQPEEVAALAKLRREAPAYSIAPMDREPRPKESTPTANKLSMVEAAMALAGIGGPLIRKRMRWILEKYVHVGWRETGAGYLTFHFAGLGGTRLAAHHNGWTQEYTFADGAWRRSLAWASVFGVVDKHGFLRLWYPGVRRGQTTAEGNDGVTGGLARYYGLGHDVGADWLKTQGRATMVHHAIRRSVAEGSDPFTAEEKALLLRWIVKRDVGTLKEIVAGILQGSATNLPVTFHADGGGNFDAVCEGIVTGWDNPVSVTTYANGVAKELRASPKWDVYLTGPAKTKSTSKGWETTFTAGHTQEKDGSGTEEFRDRVVTLGFAAGRFSPAITILWSDKGMSSELGHSPAARLPQWDSVDDATPPPPPEGEEPVPKPTEPQKPLNWIAMANQVTSLAVVAGNLAEAVRAQDAKAILEMLEIANLQGRSERLHNFATGKL